jgi:HEPN domain-containing protein
MTNRELADAHLRQAEEILIEARGLQDRAAWNLVVRRAQEAVELALKATLRAAGVEVPRVHDVGAILREYSTRFPDELRVDIDKLATISRRLGRERELSFYGDEQAGAAPQRLYTPDDAVQAIADAEVVLAWVRRALPEPQSPSPA